MHNSRQAGFTLIELMMTLVIAAILISVAVPSFREFRTNQQIKLTGQSLQSAFQLARTEAIKRSADVFVTANGNWQSGWFISTESTHTYADCTKAVPETGCIQIFSGNSATSIVPSTAATQVTYSRTGRPTPTGLSFTVCDDALSSTYTERVISIGTNGMATVSYGGNCS